MKMKLSILRSSKSFSLLNFEKVSNIFFNCKNYLLLTLWFASSNYAVSHFFNSRFFWMFAVKKNKPFQLNSTSIYAALFSISSINSIYDEIKKKKRKENLAWEFYSRPFTSKSILWVIFRHIVYFEPSACSWQSFWRASGGTSIAHRLSLWLLHS